MRILTTLALAAAGIAVVFTQPASASCVGTPPAAKTVFTGTVTATGHGGRQATVRTDDGRTVIVSGTPDLDAAATSVDRTFTAGARYEFHALNDMPPYQDNACTATRQIGTAPEAGMQRVTAWALAGAGTAVIAVLALLLLRRRSRRPAPPSP